MDWIKIRHSGVQSWRTISTRTRNTLTGYRPIENGTAWKEPWSHSFFKQDDDMWFRIGKMLHHNGNSVAGDSVWWGQHVRGREVQEYPRERTVSGDQYARKPEDLWNICSTEWNVTFEAKGKRSIYSFIQLNVHFNSPALDFYWPP